MYHVAIMKKSWNLIDKILSGEKTIESRWYKSRFSPWGRIQAGDVVYFKNSGEKITAKASVSKVLQFADLDLETVGGVVEKYGKQICLQDTNYENWADSKRYCVLVFLSEPETIESFDIDKTGFGNACAWITVEDINKIKK